MTRSCWRALAMRSIVTGLCGLCSSTAIGAAQAPGARTDGADARTVLMPDASFEAMFRKFTPPANDFARLYSWDAHMALELTVLRAGANAVNFRSTFQSGGTENVRSRVSVGGTGYILDLGYVRRLSTDFTLSAGIAHLSTHLTRDLDDKIAEIRLSGGEVPVVVDPSEYNVFYFAGRRRLPAWPLAPELEIVVEPVNFRFNGGPPRDVRPLYLGTRATLWHGAGKSLVARTQHEVGGNPFNYFSLSLNLRQDDGQRDGRFQLFMGASPGRGIHVSPNIGALRDGVALGFRMAFQS